MADGHFFRLPRRETGRVARRGQRHQFKDSGFAVIEASTGASGLRAVARVRPYGVLIGGELSEICSADVIEALKAEYMTRGLGISGLDCWPLRFLRNRPARPVRHELIPKPRSG
jgi:hypothetical protein